MVLVLGGIAAQASRRVETADDFRALGFDALDRRGQFFGLQRGRLQQQRAKCGAQAQVQQVAVEGHSGFLAGAGTAEGVLGGPKFSRARARLASDNSPR